MASALDAVAGKDPLDPRQREVTVERYSAGVNAGVSGLRIGVVAEGFGVPEAEADVETAVREAVHRLANSASIVDLSIPQHAERGGTDSWGLFAEAVAAILQSNGLGYHWRGQYDTETAIAFGEGLQARADRLPPQGKLEALLGTFLRERYHGRFYAKAQNLGLASVPPTTTRCAR